MAAIGQLVDETTVGVGEPFRGPGSGIDGLGDADEAPGRRVEAVLPRGGEDGHAERRFGACREAYRPAQDVGAQLRPVAAADGTPVADSGPSTSAPRWRSVE